MAVEPTNTNVMKAIISRTALLLATALVLGTVQAAEPLRKESPTTVKRSAMERTLDRALSRHLAFPLAEKAGMHGDVYISFVIDQEGKIEVLDCSSTNETLKAYVLRKLALIDIGDNPDGVWRTTHMRIAFKPEKVDA
jgi:outer membrane biosynthesis protein TonB